MTDLLGRPPIVGVIGGGQLARMMIAPAVELGIELRVLAEAQGMSAELAATAVGDYRDAASVLAFAEGCDVLTFDHEHVPQTVHAALADADFVVHPGWHALRFAQDKLDMRARMAELGLPQPNWAAVQSAAELDDFIAANGGKAVVKTPRGGYDGKGVRVVEHGAQAADWFAALAEDDRGGALLAEELVPFDRELAQLIARRPSGEIRAWPVVETVQENGICAQVIAPAPGVAASAAADIEAIARVIAEGLDVTGVFAVELFYTADGRALINELAMRPHNSGHWTQDGATTSQFEQHLRAVLDLPLGETAPTAPVTVMVNILGGPEGEVLADRFAGVMAAYPSAKLHSYGKASRPGRKVGHINLSGGELDAVLVEARAARSRFN